MLTFPSWNPGIWFAQNWTYIAGWGGVAVAAQRLYVFVSGLIGLRTDLTTLKLDVVTIRDNHLPHIQDGLESVNANITGLRTDVRDGFDRLTDTMNVVLTRVG